MRLLVLDQSHILPWIVRRELPSDAPIEVCALTRIEDAERMLKLDPPDAAVVSMPPADVDWCAFHRLCADQNPPIPVLYESCVPQRPSDFGVEETDDGARILTKPVATEDLQRALRWLVDLACARRQLATHPPLPDG